MLDQAANWLSQHTGIVALVGLFSFVLLAVSLLATPWVLAKLPVNYFSNPPQRPPLTLRRMFTSTLKTVLGVLMLLTGIVMMFTPGPGLVCLVLGMALCEFPGKHQLMGRFVSQSNVFSALNWLRAKAEKPPFERPHA